MGYMLRYMLLSSFTTVVGSCVHSSLASISSSHSCLFVYIVVCTVCNDCALFVEEHYLLNCRLHYHTAPVFRSCVYCRIVQSLEISKKYIYFRMLTARVDFRENHVNDN
jgi:hypothetical protein